MGFYESTNKVSRRGQVAKTSLKRPGYVWPYHKGGQLLLFVLGVTGAIQTIVGFTCGPLSRANDDYLNASVKSTLRIMIPIAVAKGAMDVVEGSESTITPFGVGIELETGDIVQPLIDYLDVAWRILLISLMFSTVAKYTLLGSGDVANVFFCISLAAYIILILTKRIQAIKTFNLAIKRIAALCLLVSLLFAVILPLTIFCTSKLSSVITAPLQADLFSSFDHLGEVFNMEGIMKQEGLLDKASALKDKTGEILIFCGSAISDVASSVAKLAVVEILNGIVFPLASLAFLIWLVRGTLYPALGLSEKSVAQDDFRRLGKFIRQSDAGREIERPNVG